jgi:phage portal protein BeeE
MWEETINRDLIQPGSDLYARFERQALVRGDIKARAEHYVKMLQWGVLNPNEVRELEDRNPRDGGDDYYDPPNTAGEPANDDEPPEPGDDPNDN